MLNGEHPIPDLSAEVCFPYACLEQRMLPHDGHSAGTAGRTPGHFSVLPKQRQQWTQLRILSSAQQAPRDLLPRQLPGMCKGTAAWLMAARHLSPSAQRSSQGRAVGSGTQPVSAPPVLGRGNVVLRGDMDVTRSGFYSPRSYHGFCPRKGCDQQEMNSRFVYSLQSPPAESEGNAGCFPQLHPPPNHGSRNNQDGSSSCLYKPGTESPCLNLSVFETLHCLHWSFKVKNLKICPWIKSTKLI